MGILGSLYFSLPIALLFWAKAKLSVKIYRVVLLSFLPLFIVSIIVYFYSAIDTGRWLNSLNIVILINFFGYMFYYPILVVCALLVKFLQQREGTILTSALFGSLMGAFLMFIPLMRYYDIFFLLIIFLIGFISVLIEDKIFKGKK